MILAAIGFAVVFCVPIISQGIALSRSQNKLDEARRMLIDERQKVATLVAAFEAGDRMPNLEPPKVEIREIVTPPKFCGHQDCLGTRDPRCHGWQCAYHCAHNYMRSPSGACAR